MHLGIGGPGRRHRGPSAEVEVVGLAQVDRTTALVAYAGEDETVDAA